MLKKSKKEKPVTDKNINPDAADLKDEGAVMVDGDTENISGESKPEGQAPEVPESAEDEIARVKNQYLRLMADFDNYRKRQAREREEIIKRSNERLLNDILPVVDHLDLALKKVNAPEDPFATGVKLVHDQFLGVLTRYGLTPIEAQGEEFDPKVHEALSYIPSPVVPANRVIDQFRCGWDLSGHLMRAAQVIVSSGKPDDAAEQECVSD